MYTVWYFDKYKITFKLVISHWTNEILQRIVVSSGLSRPGIIDSRARYRAAARRLRSTALKHFMFRTVGMFIEQYAKTLFLTLIYRMAQK